jgi:hypothetical protein
MYSIEINKYYILYFLYCVQSFFEIFKILKDKYRYSYKFYLFFKLKKNRQYR